MIVDPTSNSDSPAGLQSHGLTVFLYGPPGSGKTELGRRLARRLVLPFTDLDSEIERAAGRTIPEIFAADGESGFRAQEDAALSDALVGGPRVIALGGGALLDPSNRARAEAAGTVLCLTATRETLLARLRAARAERPLLGQDDASRLESLLAQRGEHYASFPAQLDTGSLTPEEAMWEAQVRLGAFHVQGMGDGYGVRVAPGGLRAVGRALQALGLNGPVGLVTDEMVGPLYADRIVESLEEAGYEAGVVVIPVGEAHKNLDTLGRIWSGLLAAAVERRSTVLALGGGVVGDLAGFAGASLMRGVPWVILPTSLLAMVDASLGGKTGVDLAQGKNLIGAFHPPRFVLVDPSALGTLPPVELRCGLAEVVKHAVVGDPALFRLCATGWDAVNRDRAAVVRQAMAVKIRIIEADPFEEAERAALNFGHTVGHALEQASGYRMRHGEAVAIGMVAEARLAERLGLAERGLADRIARALHGLDLPTDWPADLDRGALLDAMRVDKKRRGGRVEFALPRRIGEVQVGVGVDVDYDDLAI